MAFIRILRATPLPDDAARMRIAVVAAPGVGYECRIVCGDAFTCQVTNEPPAEGEAAEVVEVSREEWERFLEPTRFFREEA